MKNKVLIIGGTGFIGYHLIKSLRKRIMILLVFQLIKLLKIELKMLNISS